MGPRRSHRKSRNGCPECKSRRLKCDERYPCANCVKHGIQCSFVAPVPSTRTASADLSVSTNSTSQSLPVQSGPPIHHSHVHLPGSLDAPTPNGSFVGGISGSGSSPPESETRLDLLNHLPDPRYEVSGYRQNWALDLELMHHFSTVTCNTLAIREDARHVWRVVMPMEGYSNEYILHGILSIAAVHKSYLSPMPAKKEKYSKASAYHLAAGLKVFRELIASPIDTAHWQTVFCFASMTTIHLCTVPLRQGGARWPDPIANTVELLSSVKGLQAIMRPFLPSLGRSHLAPLANAVWLESEMRIHSTSLSQHSLLPSDIWLQLGRLHQWIKTCPIRHLDGDGVAQDSDLHHRKDYEIAIRALENSTRQIELAGPHPEAGMIFLWAYPLSKQFYKALLAHCPAALVILAHCCVLLQSVDDRWYLKGLAHQLLQDIDRNINPAYRDWLTWPRHWILQP
ncbi:hypothetical protein N7539_002542 [Penicillium diatomitis]|uniref:Zn(2)-C6 fungal-type domain-containing protein n=1 Tax=Penicillium diatomitis TaxID=2819901 RepID=A0A9X0BYR0_9EURO|nr:uncharacterized protein N7539_002542 [Penicillium diatomitis]KAJ5490975.1 hypothetical protein N7539_002542 [Penicillium diatomitis]